MLNDCNKSLGGLLLFYQEAERPVAATLLLLPNKLPPSMVSPAIITFRASLFLHNESLSHGMASALGLQINIEKRFEFSYLDGTNIEKRSARFIMHHFENGSHYLLNE